MAIYYKFKSVRDYNTIAMDGPFISVGILKDKIFETKRLGCGKDLDIVVSNAQTNEEYMDESMLIPKNTSVLVRRVPRAPRITVITRQEPRMEKRVEQVQVQQPDIPVVNPPTEEDEWDGFGYDLYSIPKAPRPVDEKVEEESKIQALIDTPALRQGYNRGRGTPAPPPGYICHRCNVPGHLIQHCLTNGDPNYDVKRVKAVELLKANEDAFDKQMEELGLLSPKRSVGELPPELKCPLCKQVMRDAALKSKCCFQSFCDKCIRDHIISKYKCVCGATDVLADDILPNKTLRDTINRILEGGNDSTESLGHIPDLESARCPPPSTSVASKGEQKPAEVAEITSAPRAVKVDGPVAAKEATSSSKLKEEAELGKKKARVPGIEMQWNHMMQMGPGPQYLNEYFGGPFPFMNYGMNPMDMNMMHPDPFVAHGFGFPNMPPPHSRMMMNNGASASASSINPPNKVPPPPRRPERLSPPRDSKRKYPEERDRQHSSRHQELDHHNRDRREEDRSSRDNHHRDSERSQHHTRKRSEIDNHKSSVCFSEEEPSSKRQKVSSYSSSSTELPPANALHHHRHSRKQVQVAAEYESSHQEDRHFKRKPSRYEPSPPVVCC